MSTLNDELYDQHDDEDDLDDDLDDDEDHAIDSDIALDRFTDRAMCHGRRAATWLLIGALAEVGFFVGVCYAVTSVRSLWLIVPAAMMTSVVMFMLAGLINIRWDRHRTRMESVIGEAMGWRSDVQQKREGEERAYTRRHLARIEEERLDALREEMTWNVGPAPVYIDADDHEAIAAYEQRREIGPEFGDLFDSLDRRSDEHDGDAESDNVPDAPDSPALRAWMQRWADVKPVKQSRPAPLLKRHDNAEGRRLERELCRAINRHWDGAFHRLIAEGADVNGHNGSGQPLRKAVLRGRLEHISWLLTLGADPNRQAFGRTMLAMLMVQVDMQVDEGDGSGDDFEWPEIIELLARFGANPHIKNEHYDSDSDAEGPTAWPFICRYPVLYEAFMKGHNAWLQADLDARRLLADARGLADVADVTRAMLDTARGAGRA
ncbi:hypothetical protein WK35_25350 [Burkholderia vietnamiensis]|uniref:ankyrin repeat domain-containing protein n=1 Tax=Burkholderia vietnamiensis TaxID=60552 RepID=UPI0007617C6D|nr:ankyrin repeat domain-containing protein [Burkholderia vietnamiensis]KVS42077.1 hypothetical protein WK35_25350 [Burkholderia vietnamiensis]